MFKQFLYLIIGLIILVVTLWWTRYQVVDAPALKEAGFYRIDRLTGKAELVTFPDMLMDSEKLVVITEE
jgi:hypothetical protein